MRTNKLLAGFAVVGMITFAGGQALAGGGHHHHGADIEVEVAEDFNSFSFHGPTNDAGPAYGANFIIQGVIYPEGTIDASSGMNPDGTAEFPDKVIGTWICRGWFIGDGLATTTGPFVVTHQVFDFHELRGSPQIMTDGLELIDFNTPFKRAITGGTSRFDDAAGELTQETIGLNATQGFNFTFDFDLDRDRYWRR